ncbi:MAG: hypothetical protein JKX71_13990, partial [Amylibacter sp.]|nr:hypothetical protein [Amylibacter sp.]
MSSLVHGELTQIGIQTRLANTTDPRMECDAVISDLREKADRLGRARDFEILFCL